MSALRVGIVGPCAAGKSTLITGLAEHGYNARHIAQEHSYVQDMWQRISRPDVLIYLHVDYAQTLARRPTNWTEAEYNIQLERLAHARRHAHLTIDTTRLSIKEVLDAVLGFLADLPDETFTNSKNNPENPITAL